MNSAPNSFSLMLAQLNPIVGDVMGNAQKAREAIAKAKAAGADIIVFPELFICGYPPEDLVMKNAFVEACMEAVQDLAALSEGGPAIVIGAPWIEKGGRYNAVAVLEDGALKDLRFKHHLPNYGVFDEIRVFDKGPKPAPVTIKGVSVGLPICEDIWHGDVCDHLRDQGAEILIVPNGSPYDRHKKGARDQVAKARVAENGVSMVYVNQVGGQDELVFDGTSFVMDPQGNRTHRLKDWEEQLVPVSFARILQGWSPQGSLEESHEDDLAAIWQAMMVGLRDYVEKNRFPSVVLGMSGGIDSALTAAVAVDALGADRVRTVMMPYRYTSSDSFEDAEQCSNALGAPYDIVPIAPAVEGFGEMLAGQFADTQADTTEENIQSRSRGLLLMALSNKFGSMVLTTGNKSEVSVGYATLYGDMVGGYNVLKDIYKTEVFALARWRNEHHPKNAKGPAGEVIPTRIITKPPTAELREDQKDEDSLPPYEVLDDILTCLVEEEMSVPDIIARGHEPDVVARIEHLLYIAEYKRRQAAPGVKISQRNFGRDRRYPITNGFRNSRLK